MALGGVRGQHHAPAATYPCERFGTSFTGGVWASGRVGQEQKNLAPTRIRSPSP